MNQERLDLESPDSIDALDITSLATSRPKLSRKIVEDAVSTDWDLCGKDESILLQYNKKPTTGWDSAHSRKQHTR